MDHCGRALVPPELKSQFATSSTARTINTMAAISFPRLSVPAFTRMLRSRSQIGFQLDVQFHDAALLPDEVYAVDDKKDLVPFQRIYVADQLKIVAGQAPPPLQRESGRPVPRLLRFV